MHCHTESFPYKAKYSDKSLNN